MTRWPKSSALILVAAMAAGLAACGEEAPSNTVILTRGNRSEPSTLDPHKSVMTDEWAILRDLYVGLTMHDSGGHPVAGAAASWDVSPDGLTYTFLLRDGLKWSDGTAMTSADFVAGLQRLFDPKTLSPAAHLAPMIANARAIVAGDAPPEGLGVTAPDARTVIVMLEQPAPIVLNVLAMPFAAPYPAQQWIERDKDALTTPSPNVYDGPYQLRQWRPDSDIELVKNPNFFGAADVAIDVVRYIPTPDDDAALRRYQAGDLDMNGWFSTSRAQWLAENLPEDTHSGPALGVSYLVFNTTEPPFDSRDMRCRVSVAVDTQALARDVLRGAVDAAASFVPASVSMYGSLAVSRNYDTAVNREPLAFDFRVRGTPDDRKTAAALQQMWAEAGIEASIVTADLKTHFDDLENANFTVADAGWALFDSPESFLLVLSSEDGGFLNYGRYAGTNFERQYHVALAQADPSVRAAYFAQAEKFALEDCAVLPLYHYRTRNLVKPYVEGFVSNPADIHPSMFLRVNR